jgi:hypothetical protein
MAADDPNVVMVPVTRHDVNLSIEDIMKPLTAFANQPRVAQAAAAMPDVQQHAAQLAGLAQQVLDVANRLKAVEPSLLSSTNQTSSR